jgi:Amidohydrolase family
MAGAHLGRSGGARAALLLLLAACRTAGPGEAAAPATVDGVVAASVIDSHVHLAYWPVAEQLADAGIAAVVDLGAPLASLGGPAPLTVVSAGPMLTRPGGYPIDAWDPGGFGRGCADAACVDAAITEAADRGAKVIKLVTGAGGLAPPLAARAVAVAHARGLRVAAHALDDEAAAAAAAAGCDLLAHTPVAPLADATVQAWAQGAVISTLAAFGGSPSTVDNLRRLRAAGTTVLYGTDLGNTRTAGVDGDELGLLAAAGLDGRAIVLAMTTAPARYWRLPELGQATVGPAASYVILDRDPTVDPTAYLAPRAVFVQGQRRR